MTRPLMVLSHYFPPCGSVGGIRTVKWCRYLPEAGWTPHVLAAPAVPGGVYGHDAEETDRVARTGSVTRVGPPPASAGEAAASRLPAPLRRALRLAVSPLWATDTRFAWMRAAMPEARRLAGRVLPRAILASFSPVADLEMAVRLKRELGIPAVFDFRDPWTGNASAVYAAPWQRAFERRQERRLLGEADLVVAATREMGRSLEAAGARRVSVLVNGYDEGDFPREPQDPEPGVFRLVFVGKLYGSASLAGAARALALLAGARPDLKGRLFLRVVGGLSRGGAEEVRRAGFGGGLEDLGPRSHPEAVREMCRAHALLLPPWTGPGTSMVQFSKLYEYLRSGRPILAPVPPGEARRILEGRGHAVLEPDAPPERLREVLEGWVDRLPGTRVPGDLLPFSRRALALELGRLLDEVAGRA